MICEEIPAYDDYFHIEKYIICNFGNTLIRLMLHMGYQHYMYNPDLFDVFCEKRMKYG